MTAKGASSGTKVTLVEGGLSTKQDTALKNFYVRKRYFQITDKKTGQGLVVDSADIRKIPSVYDTGKYTVRPMTNEENISEGMRRYEQTRQVYQPKPQQQQSQAPSSSSQAIVPIPVPQGQQQVNEIYFQLRRKGFSDADAKAALRNKGLMK